LGVSGIRAFAVWLGSLGLAAVIAACGGAGASDSNGVIVSTVPPAALEATATAMAQPTAVPQPTTADLRGFSFPIAGACLPKGDQLMPNAPRAYRNGIHEGIDFYASDNCTVIARGTPVLAGKAGRVIRADLAYTDLTSGELAQVQANPTTEESLDKFRGRQVWVDHGNGVVTRYAHLSGIAPGIEAGSMVAQGQQIAFVGESGTPESITRPGSEYHLHFEVRVLDSYLGKGETPAQVRGLYQTLFSP
jgi:murein DD-endopeptidase MepM/ murein hydrolase activator NlpD